MATEITFEELEANYFDFMRRVCLGESFTIARDGSAVAILHPIPGAGRNEEAAKVFEELDSPRFAGASDDAIREWLGEKPPRQDEVAGGGEAGVSSATKEGEAGS